MSYEMIDYFLRNNLDDDDYAEYSAALDSLCSPVVSVQISHKAIADAEQVQPVAWMYTLEYGDTVVDTKVSLDRLRYPFGVCGADYLRSNDSGMSYVRETPLSKA